MAIISQRSLFSWENVDAESDIIRLQYALESLDDERLMRLLEERRGRGRDDYPVRAVWNCVVAMKVFGHETVSSLVRELRRNGELRCAVGLDPFGGASAVPGEHVFSRFLKVLAELSGEVEGIFHGLVDTLEGLVPDFGKAMACDAKAVRSYAARRSGRVRGDGRSELDADVGVKTREVTRRNGTKVKAEKRWFGFKAHLLVDAKYELPVAYEVTRASMADSPELLNLVEKARERHPEIAGRCEYLSADRGYDSAENNRVLFEEYGILPVIDIRDMCRDGEATRLIDPHRAGNIVYNHRGEILCVCPSTGETRAMAYWGYEKDRRALKYRCPAAAFGLTCRGRKACPGSSGKYGRTARVPIALDRRKFVPLPRSTYKWRRYYSSRSSVERVNSRLDVSFGFEHHTIRGLKKMKLWVGISLVVMLAMAVGHVRASREEMMRSLVGRARAA
jgi:hypothetical protein